VCCATCGNGQQCCDEIHVDNGGLTLEPAACVGEGQFDGYLSFCCAGGNGEYTKDPNTGQIGAYCAQPQAVFP
jgi:hypothetical protein